MCEMEKYKILVEVFKGYFDTALTANIWFYAFTGGVVTYYLSNKPVEPYLRYSLLLPVFLGVLLMLRSLVGMRQAYDLQKAMLSEGNNKRVKMNSNIKRRIKKSLLILFKYYKPSRQMLPVEILVGYLRATIISVSLVCVGLIVLFFGARFFLF